MENYKTFKGTASGWTKDKTIKKLTLLGLTAYLTKNNKKKKHKALPP